MPVNPTPASAWKRPQAPSEQPLGIVVQLPSGNSAKVVRSVNFFTMVKENRLPNPIGEVVNRMISNKEEDKHYADGIEVTAKAAAAMTNFIDQLLVDCMVEPEFVIPPVDEQGQPVEGWEQPENSITPADMVDEDKFFLFSVVLGGTTDLEQFRKQSSEIMAVTSDVPDIQPKAIDLPRTRRPLPGMVPR